MKNLFLTMVVTGMCICITSCSLFKPASQTPAPQRIAMKFDYAPPTEGVAKSNNIKVALVRPRFVPTFQHANTDPYKTFVGNMATDFVEMLSARGYSYIGPLTTYDEMVYSDKKSTDLVLEAEADLQFASNGLKESATPNFATGATNYSYYFDGNITITGKVNLIFSEPFTKTKIWVKSVPIDPINFAVKSTYKYTTKNLPDTDPGIWNSLVNNLDDIYIRVLTTAWNHLEPEELMVKKSEAAEIKKNSGFVKQ